MRTIRFLSTAALMLANLAAANNVCPVTKPPSPAFIPPAPYQVNPGLNAFWFGDKDLWTLLPIDGVWSGLPLNANKNYFNKVFLWQQGYDGKTEPQPDVNVVVRRLDANAAVYKTQYATNAFFDYTWQILTDVTFMSEGCWEITATHNRHNLTFVVSVQP
jgi:hypothetical protein